MVKPQFEVGRERVGKGGVVRDRRRPARRRWCRSRRARAALGASVLGFASSGLPGPKGNRETFLWLAEGGRAGAVDDLEAAARGGRARVSKRRARPHAPAARRRPACAFEPLLAAAREAGLRRCASTPTRPRKHGLSAGGRARARRRPDDADVDLCIVLGGDGTILAALRRFAHTGVPVFAVNFGEVGFLATIEPEEMERDFDRAFARRVRGAAAARRSCSTGPTASVAAINDVSIHRKVGERVAQLAYLDRGRGGRVGALRRRRRRHAGGVDGLQPRQRRAGAGVGRGGLRRLVHRAALADRAGARRRAERHADDLRTARATGSTSSSTGGRSASWPPGEAVDARFRARRRAAGAGAGVDVLPAAAREVRPPVVAEPCDGSVPERIRTCVPSAGWWHGARRARRASCREPPADRAGRAAARPGPERPDRRDGRGQDDARPRAGPAAGRQGAAGHRAARAPARRTSRACSTCPTRCAASWASGCPRTPTRSCSRGA